MPTTYETETAELELGTGAEWTPETMDEHAEYIAEKVVAGELDGWKVFGVPFRNTDY